MHMCVYTYTCTHVEAHRSLCQTGRLTFVKQACVFTAALPAPFFLSLSLLSMRGGERGRDCLLVNRSWMWLQL